MTADDMTLLETFFAGYTRRFAGADGRLHPMQQLKVAHSWRVVANAEHIMTAGQWPEAPRRLGRAAALLHDVGRFSQYAETGSFEDRRSFDHAARSAEVLLAEGVLSALSAGARETILAAVRQHNVRELPATLAAAQARFAHLVRDADKLDIFRVLEDAIRDGHLEDHPEIAWSLPETGLANPVILAAVSAGQTVSYQHVHSLCDFVLIQVGWLHSLLHYDAAVALAAARGALEFRERFVCAVDDSSAVRACFAATRAAMQVRLDKYTQGGRGPAGREGGCSCAG
ncbi:MAG: HD domain-containing protein [bacterium]